MTIYLNSRLLAPASLSIFLAIFRAVAANNETPSTAPQAPEILGRLKTGHPRLLASVQDFAALKKRIASDPKLETWHTTLQNQAEKLLTAPPSQYEIPDGLRLLATSRRVLDRTYTLALLYRLDGDKKYAERAWQELETAANFKDW